jgi:nucleotide-binding universal stress UspA family protein
MRFDRVLIPLDGSAQAERAVSMAIALSDRESTYVQLLRATEAKTRPGVDSMASEIATVREAEGYLNRVAQGLSERGFKHVKTSVWYGGPTAAILEAARVGRASLIIMTTHGRSGLAHLVLGSVAEGVVRSAGVPVLVLRGSVSTLSPPDTAYERSKQETPRA